ncbi:Transcriptional activator NphR [Streptomyces sp. YIM 130001]|uniref:AraC family transcriptional regulator n=1 Tax=Streptomyces sp. YIM 130001 TaxID=2259644 RepID=UPI000E65853A|nr:AraC family transcriptional regulator [Streptomyces sp. YIM 130001]RII17675.1 Transcriptional activator NphR [Streptomyces sp. YIM 130001]
MIATVFRSDELPAAEQFECWGDRMGERMSGFYVQEPAGRRAEEPGFFAEERELALGPVHVASLRFAPVDINRRSGNRDLQGEGYQLLVPLEGTLLADWDGTASASGPGSLYVHDEARLNAFGCRAPDELGTFHTATVHVPKDLLPLPTHSVERLLGQRLAGADAFGGLLAGLVTRLITHADTYRASDGPRLGATVLDLVHAHLAHLLETEGAAGELEPETRQRVLLMRIMDFIRRNLHDPDLTPRAVAEAHHISVSYLHRIFQAHTPGSEATVARWIREQRLARTRRDLTDSALRATPVHRIAARWGFAHAAAFSRAFRAAYGLPPGDYRRQMLHPDR